MTHRPTLEVERIEPENPKMVIYRLAGRLLGTKECYDFLNSLRDDVHAGRSAVVIDLEKVTRIASPGIGIIAACHTAVMNEKGSMALAGVQKEVRMPLELVCLWGLLKAYDTQEDAIAGLS